MLETMADPARHNSPLKSQDSAFSVYNDNLEDPKLPSLRQALHMHMEYCLIAGLKPGLAACWTQDELRLICHNVIVQQLLLPCCPCAWLRHHCCTETHSCASVCDAVASMQVSSSGR